MQEATKERMEAEQKLLELLNKVTELALKTAVLAKDKDLGGEDLLIVRSFPDDQLERWIADPSAGERELKAEIARIRQVLGHLKTRPDRPDLDD